MSKHTLLSLATVACVVLATSNARAVPLAHYIASAGPANDTNFDTPQFDSVDTDPLTDALRLTQGGGLDGGGSGNLVISNSFFNTSPSGNPGYNFDHSSTSDFASATAAGDYFELVVSPMANVSVLYESLTWWGNSFDTGSVAVSIDGVVEETVTPTGGNANVGLITIDFDDFTSSSPVTFRFTQWGTTNPNGGIRYDDIIVNGEATAVPEPATAALGLLALGGLGAMTRRRRA